MVEAGAKDTVDVLYNFWKENAGPMEYHCEWRQVGNVFSPFESRREHSQPGAMSRLQFDMGTSVHQLWLSQNSVSMENRYDYEVLMVEAGAKDTVDVLYNFWKENAGPMEYHCEWRQVGNVFSPFESRREHSQPGAMSRLQFDMGTSVHQLWLSQNLVSMEKPLRLRGSDGGSRCGKNVLDILTPVLKRKP